VINKKLLTIVLLTVIGVQAVDHGVVLSLGAIASLTAGSTTPNPLDKEKQRQLHIKEMEKLAFSSEGSLASVIQKRSSHKKVQQNYCRQGSRNGNGGNGLKGRSFISTRCIMPKSSKGQSNSLYGLSNKN